MRHFLISVRRDQHMHSNSQNVAMEFRFTMVVKLILLHSYFLCFTQSTGEMRSIKCMKGIAANIINVLSMH